MPHAILTAARGPCCYSLLHTRSEEALGDILPTRPPAMPPSRLVLGGLAAVALLLAACTAQMHTRVEVIDDTCDAQLGYLWGNYTNPPVAPVAGCDRYCLAACQATLEWAIYSEKQQNCPLQTDIIRCFHVSCRERGGAVAGVSGGRRQAGRPHQLDLLCLDLQLMHGFSCMLSCIPCRSTAPPGSCL